MRRARYPDTPPGKKPWQKRIEDWPHLVVSEVLAEDGCRASGDFLISGRFRLIHTGNIVALVSACWMDKTNPGWRELAL